MLYDMVSSLSVKSLSMLYIGPVALRETSRSVCQRGVVPVASRARRWGAGEPSSSLLLLLRFLFLLSMPISSISRRNRVARLPCVPPGLAGLVMLNWLGCRSRAEASEISSASFSLLSLNFLVMMPLIRRSRRV